MPLDLGGEFNNVRWMATLNKWVVSDGEEVALTSAVFDLEHLKQGWILLAKGEAPQEIWDNGRRGPKPSADAEWKRGFEVEVYAPKAFGDEEPRRFMTNATGACLGIQALYTEYEAQAGDNPGKVPLCKFDGGEPTKIGMGSTSIPKLSITKWIERPASLVNGGAVTSGDSGNSPPDDDVEF